MVAEAGAKWLMVNDSFALYVTCSNEAYYLDFASCRVSQKNCLLVKPTGSQIQVYGNTLHPLEKKET